MKYSVHYKQKTIATNSIKMEKYNQSDFLKFSLTNEYG